MASGKRNCPSITVAAFTASLNAASSPAAKTFGWLARICSIKVEPDRGMPKMNTGAGEASPSPAFARINSGVNTRAVRSSSPSTAASS